MDSSHKAKRQRWHQRPLRTLHFDSQLNRAPQLKLIWALSSGESRTAFAPRKQRRPASGPAYSLTAIGAPLNQNHHCDSCIKIHFVYDRDDSQETTMAVAFSFNPRPNRFSLLDNSFYPEHFRDTLLLPI